MTCIVGLVHRKTVWLGGDSAATDGYLNRTIIKDPKVFIRGQLAFGVCGSPKVMDALAHGIDFPAHNPSLTNRGYLVKVLVPAIRQGLVALDAAGEEKGSSGSGGIVFDGEMLIGYRGELYKLQENFQLIKSSDEFDTTGSGGSLALGSLVATRNMKDPKRRILTALQASTANAGCAPPFVVISLKG